MFERVLVPVDGSPASSNADGIAAALAGAFDGRVRFVFVLDIERLQNELGTWDDTFLAETVDRVRSHGEEMLRRAAVAAFESHVPYEVAILEGNTVEQIILDAAAWHADVIVIGTHGRAMALSAALGSKTAELLRRSTLPVLVVR